MQSDEKVDAVALEGRRQTLALMWKELREHSRQHEAQRAVATNMILVLASADIGIMATIRFGHRTLPLAAGLIVLGVFGYLLSVKHYDRAEWSTAVAVELERRLEELDPNLGIAAAKRAGNAFHTARLPRLSRLRLNKVWSSLHLVVAVAGLITVIASLASG